MSVARDNVDRLAPLYRAICPAVPVYVHVVEDEPVGGDGGVAHAHPFHPDFGWCLTFDKGREPTDENVGHEIGHLAAFAAMKVMGVRAHRDAYWKARGFPGTYDQDRAEYRRAKKAGTLGSEEWERDPDEAMAESLVTVYTGRDERTWDRGVPLTPAIRERLRAFYASLPSWPEPVMPKPEVEARIARFWDLVDQMPPDALLDVADLRDWLSNVFDRDPTARVVVRDFRAFAAQLQAALDFARTP